MIPSRDDVDAYLGTLEQYVVHAVSAVTPEIPNVHEAFNRLWVDLTRYGPPSLPSLSSVPGLGKFEVPAPPRPPPPPPSLLEKLYHWAYTHRLAASLIGLGLASGGVVISRAAIGVCAKRRAAKRPRIGKHDEKRQVVVVLGGDTALGAPLVAGLETAGYIVIASVSTPEAVRELEMCCNGFTKALVLDPLEPASIPYFLRSLQSTMSLRFPLNLHGDPHASPATHPYIHSVISLLTLPYPTATPPPGPLEQLNIDETYLPYLTATHLLPLQLVQSLLPLFRSAPRSPRGTRKTVLFCVPATHAQVGVPFAAAQAMSAAATVRGADVLRREIRAAALTSPSMHDLRVVVADVGAVGLPVSPAEFDDDLTRGWTASEKATYGPAVLSAIDHDHSHGVRKPADTAVFVDALVRAVGGGDTSFNASLLWQLNTTLGVGKIRDCLSGNRFPVGAGARTYSLASRLPHTVLDFLLNLPHFLLSVRNTLMPAGPLISTSHRPMPSPTAIRGNSSLSHSTLRHPPLQRVNEDEKGGSPSISSPHSDFEPEASSHIYEASTDMESNAEEFEPGTSVDGSWVSLYDSQAPSMTSTSN